MKFLESGHYGIPHLIALDLLNIYSFKLRFEVLFLVIQVFKVIVKRILSNRTACNKTDKPVAGCFDLGKPLLYPEHFSVVSVLITHNRSDTISHALQKPGVLIIYLIHCGHYRFFQVFLIYGRGMLTVFLTIVEATDTSPYLFTTSSSEPRTKQTDGLRKEMNAGIMRPKNIILWILPMMRNYSENEA